MKKLYFSPKSLVIDIENEELICGSPLDIKEDDPAIKGAGEGDSDGLSKFRFDYKLDSDSSEW